MDIVNININNCNRCNEYLPFDFMRDRDFGIAVEYVCNSCYDKIEVE